MIEQDDEIPDHSDDQEQHSSATEWQKYLEEVIAEAADMARLREELDLEIADPSAGLLPGETGTAPAEWTGENLGEEDLEPEMNRLPYWDGGPVEKIPVFNRSVRFVMALIDYLTKQFTPDQGLPEIRQLVDISLIPVSRIRDGHEFGYDIGEIEDNIANCRVALAAIEDCIVILQNLRIKADVGSGFIGIYNRAVRLRLAIEAWIRELEERPWHD